MIQHPSNILQIRSVSVPKPTTNKIRVSLHETFFKLKKHPLYTQCTFYMKYDCQVACIYWKLDLRQSRETVELPHVIENCHYVHSDNNTHLPVPNIHRSTDTPLT